MCLRFPLLIGHGSDVLGSDPITIAPSQRHSVCFGSVADFERLFPEGFAMSVWKGPVSGEDATYDSSWPDKDFDQGHLKRPAAHFSPNISPHHVSRAELRGIASILSEIFGPSVLFGVEEISECVGLLLPAERALVAGACRVRQLEFSAGRVIARTLLQRMHIGEVPVLMNPNGAPLWPPRVVGAISHVSELCAVVLAPGDRILGLGLDLEHNKPIESELLEIVCTERERDWLEKQAYSSRGCMARLIFSAKECFYKYHHPLHGMPLDYKDVEIDLRTTSQEFAARVLRRPDATLHRHKVPCGKYRLYLDWIVTGMAMPH
jgi:4'-phosphopantetheinyl transferase EntD